MIGRRGRARLAALALLACVAALLAAAGPASGERAGSSSRSLQAGLLDAGSGHTCAILTDATLRCWGFGGDGELGYASTANIGDTESPASAGNVDVGAGRTVVAVAAGSTHTCAILDDGAVRCWGDASLGKLGYGNTTPIGDNETPGSVGPVNLGTGRTAAAITAGEAHTCAILDDGTVRCWGYGGDGELGYGNGATIGDDETPGSVGPVDLGAGRTATAIAAGGFHTCAILDNGSVRCWGFGANGRLGYGNTTAIGDTETPGSVGPVNLGAGRTAVAITAGGTFTCAILDDGAVRCWGDAANGHLGYGNASDIGDDETPGSVGPVALGPGRTAVAIAAGADHACTILDDGAVRCWGLGLNGRLGYGSTATVGDDETPAAAGPANLGPGRTATALAGGGSHTCALLDDGSVRCWGAGSLGRLGYGNTSDIGDDEPPAAAGPVFLGGAMPGAVADLSVTVLANTTGVAVGGDVTYTITLRNDGPDTAGPPQLLIDTTGQPTLVSSAASVGSFDAARGIWQPGSRAAGQTATLTLVERATQGGPLTVSAEVTIAPTFDPDSRPANFVSSEDDRASATATVVAAPTPPGPPPAPPAAPPAPPPAPSKASPERLTLTLTPAKDTTAPHAFTVTGRLVATTVAAATACKGTVKVTAKAGTRTITSRTATLKLADGACQYTARLSISSAQRKTARTAKVTAAFAGNDALLAASSRAATAKLA